MKKAIIKKDIRGITANKKILTVLIVVPLVMAVAIPLAFLIPILFAPADSPDLKELSKLLESAKIYTEGNLQYKLTDLMLNHVLPMFFMIIPISASSVMAASSFVGEKEKKTLETLLYSPLPLKDIFAAKILAAFLLSMAVSAFSFVVMLIVIEGLLFFVTGTMIMPNINWLITMLLISPAASLISISLIVRSSAKAQSSEESQQVSLFLIMPLILIIIGQFSGVMMLGTHVFLILGAVLAIIAVFTFKSSFGKFKYETLLR
ncbi:MAG: ABC transporter permease subunit [Fibromonadaceae bacterium]|jgi:ABC-type Na+ efflux pump permease subunit|nr:ABC transporter permease subunit [Fibromonadaceae bacterium]